MWLGFTNTFFCCIKKPWSEHTIHVLKPNWTFHKRRWVTRSKAWSKSRMKWRMSHVLSHLSRRTRSNKWFKRFPRQNKQLYFNSVDKQFVIFHCIFLITLDNSVSDIFITRLSVLHFFTFSKFWEISPSLTGPPCQTRISGETFLAACGCSCPAVGFSLPWMMRYLLLGWLHYFRYFTQH